MKLFNIKSVATLGLACGVLFTSCNKESITEEVAPQSTTRTTNDKNTPAPRVLVNGVPLVFSGAQPVNNAGNVMVPMSTIFQRLGYAVSWNQTAQKVTATKTGSTVELWIGNTIAKVNGANVSMNVAPYVTNGVTMVHSRFVADGANCRTDWDQESQSVQIYYYDELDYGFYFFDSEPGTEGAWDEVGCQKYVQGQSNRFFDPTKPTIIYVHGNAPGSVVSKSREGFKIDQGGLNVHSHNVWKSQGWNVAIFYWIQLADEGLWSSTPPASVEAKIYDSNNTQVGMRWRKADGSFSTTNMPAWSVRSLFASKYMEIFNSTYTGAEIRVVGNSLGGNLTMAGLLSAYNQGATRLPSRVTLMDPFWTPLADNTVFIGNGQVRTDQLGGLCAETLNANGTAIEYFRTSLLGNLGSSERVARSSAFTHFGADFLGNFGLNHPAKHTVPVRQYLQSRAQTSPIEIFRPNAWTAWTVTGQVTASAATSNARIRQMMNGAIDVYWNHIDGRSTATLADDRYELRNGIW